MKTTISIRSMVFFLALTLIFSTSCSDDDEKTTPAGVTSEQAIAKFKSYFYKNGEANASQLPDFDAAEWAVATDNNARPTEIFADITGVEAPLTEKYEYSYASADGQCRIRLVGNAQPDANAVYATFYIQIPQCPEFDKLYIATRDYFKGTNDGTSDGTTVTGYPVIW